MHHRLALFAATIALSAGLLIGNVCGAAESHESGRAAGGSTSQSIKNRLGIFGLIGFNVPADSDFEDFKINTDVGFIGGGGLIYGLDHNVALELDVTHTWFGSSLPSGANTGDFSVTNIALGGQFRFDPVKKLHPYVGAGIDIILNDYDKADVDTVVGGHLSGGAEYFVMGDMALSAEVRAVLAPDADININGRHVGNFSPPSISGLFGVRYYF